VTTVEMHTVTITTQGISTNAGITRTDSHLDCKSAVLGRKSQRADVDRRHGWTLKALFTSWFLRVIQHFRTAISRKTWPIARKPSRFK